ncbi:methyltransferase family protein [Salinibacter grassmerensis]|uniref:methyltransferase family protein n=1 Tax=Salinibacter grassmerensis TaxID=3040353 RepID=UPI0021E7260C|nr:PEMT/PEM2 methyltransferase family protein [Salinibacter grassmerensis]
MVSATGIVFWTALIAGVALDVTLLATLVVEAVQVWPPLGRRTWTYRLTWTLFAVACVGFLVVGGMDAGSLGLARWIGEAVTTILGSTLVVGGTALASYAMGRLGLRGCLGLNAELVTDGPFAVSRNPGYVGDLILIAGYVLLTDSGLAGIVGAVGAVWFLLAPLAEEPWLEEQYGASDRRYRQRCPRFLGRSSIRALSSKTA